MNALQKIEGIIREVFEDPELRVHPETNIREHPKWDSFNHINIMIALENEFGIVIPPRKTEAVYTVDDIGRLLKDSGANL